MLMNYDNTKAGKVFLVMGSTFEYKMIGVCSVLKRVILVLLLFVVSENSTAQEYIDLFKSDYTISPSNSFDSSRAKTDLQEFNGDLTVPIKINDRFAFLTGITYENSTASFNPGESKASVTGLSLKMGANFKHNSQWSGTYMFLPKVSSDLEQIGRRDFQFGGVVLMKYAKSKNFNYKFGMYANKELFGTFLVPIVGFYYKSPSDKFEAKVLLPLSVDLNYSMTKSFRVGLNFNGQVRSYNLNESQSKDRNTYLAKSTNEVLTYVQYGTKKGYNFQLGVGHSLARSYRVFDEKVTMGMPLVYFGDDRRQKNTDFSDGWIIKASVFYRLRFEEPKTKKL